MLRFVIGLSIGVTLVFTVGLSQQVISDLERQQSASSDNVQWTLTQVEVDYLGFVLALEQHLHDPDGPVPTNPDLSNLRRQFDVFYSRVDTLKQSRLFRELRQNPSFAGPLDLLSDFLDRSVPFIDGSQEDLTEAIPAIWRDASAYRNDVRDLSLSALAYFASTSDDRRKATTVTLAQLAALSATLLMVLTMASVYLLHVNRVMHRRENELVQTNHRMNTVLHTSLDAVIVSNSWGRVVEFNPAAEKIFGFSASEARGRTIGELIVPAHLRKAHNEGMKRMSGGGERHVVGKGRVQVEAMRKNGEIFPVELALQSATYDDQEVIIGFLQDISRRVAAEAEVISTRDKALASEKAKSEFLTVMSHEIRTPLNGLLGNLSLLKNTGPNGTQQKFISNMEVSGEILLNHVDSVLDIARFEAGKLSILREPTDLGELMQEIVDGQNGYAASRGNVIEWHWSGPPQPAVSTDKQRLRQILLNLVGNAIKFTENGQITLEVSREEQGRKNVPSTYEFRVIDTGTGIAEEKQDLIFEDFHTNDSSIGRSAGGTGLGLGIARRFTNAMGGEIGVESMPGEGSVFWVRVPMHEAQPSHFRQRESGEAENTSPLDLLVVEDNEINLVLIVNMLEMDGHRVTTARNGAEGVAAANAGRFDAILMDISMPVMDGPTATRTIRADGGKCADIPIIAVSANVLPQAVKSFREAGMTAFLGKPIKLSSLRGALGAVMDETASRDIDTTLQEDPLESLRRNLGDDVTKDFLVRFIEEADEVIKNLCPDPALPEATTELAAQCHKLAGSAAIFGAFDLRDVLIEIENAVKTGALHDISDRVDAAGHAWSSTRTRLTEQV